MQMDCTNGAEVCFINAIGIKRNKLKEGMKKQFTVQFQICNH